ncbi:hypothetical protein [Anaeromicrobium sediminis]|nr:hypothetical protein [Anaeromicrobium sediminis]
MKKIAIILVLIMAFGTVAFAAQPELYNNIKERILSIKDEFIKKDSQLVSSGDEAIEDLRDYVDEVENEIKTELGEYEQAQIEEAKKVIAKEVDSVKEQLNTEKAALTETMKEEIKNKVQKDLDKELDKLNKAFK